jgi:hypothetical protein
MKLYEITSVMRALLDTLSDNTPMSNSDEDRAEHAAALAAFEGTSDDFREKLRAMASYAIELKTEREARQAHMDLIVANVLEKMDKANKRDLAKEDWLLSAVHGAMNALNYTKPIVYETFTLALQKMPLTAVISNADALPKDYLRIVPAVAESSAPDKKKILTDLKDGIVITGAELSQPATKLVIK